MGLGIVIGEAEKSDIQIALENLSIQQFLELAYQKARIIDDMRTI